MLLFTFKKKINQKNIEINSMAHNLITTFYCTITHHQWIYNCTYYNKLPEKILAMIY